ncbi:MAG: pyruvate, phosphate dikinase/phosphoenolpyruvate synthase regulator [Candidatus Zixiibacteriota bacterium]|nr:MAG: pyruvate, phosphate dikinase/phosphoenolpyruvate synthase regulator [candidate division Zixibacteria bacterium]
MDREIKKIIIVSDGTGGTARRLMDAVLVQYEQTEPTFTLERIHQQIRTRTELDNILQQVDREYLVVYSIISKKLDEYFSSGLAERNVLHLNVLSPMLETMSKFLGVHPGYRPGILQIVDDRYYKKVDAIGYTVEHDDGRGTRIEEADAILLGLSRTCKTPISMYLACNHGLKVANIPVVKDAALTVNLLRRLEPIMPERIVGLLMQPETLAHVREERSGYLTQSPDMQAQLQEYYDIREVGREFRYCRDLYKTRQWCTIDVTRRAIEEISLEILRHLGHP